ncbi:hypothetical protein ACFWFI_04305 [Streptomyces sp. NPDC060209]|uniref:hypothetical protein n=1 Tax=Streptomyces sp. NPDC060209 TaxID=3347073 RepID=UPI00365ECC80
MQLVIGMDCELVHEALGRELREEAGPPAGEQTRTTLLVLIDFEQHHPSALAATFEIDEWARGVGSEDDGIKQVAFEERTRPARTGP